MSPSLSSGLGYVRRELTLEPAAPVVEGQDENKLWWWCVGICFGEGSDLVGHPLCASVSASVIYIIEYNRRRIAFATSAVGWYCKCIHCTLLQVDSTIFVTDPNSDVNNLITLHDSLFSNGTNNKQVNSRRK
jgi:hypothetical protein